MLVTLLVKFRNKDCKITELGLLLQVLLVRIVTFVETLGSHLKSNLESAGATQTLKSVWGCYFDVQMVPGFLFRRFCGNLKSQGKMLL